MTDCPSFSLVIPTYQRRDMVCEAVRAACAIDYAGNMQLIVVVDGSTDGTAEALKAIACKHELNVTVQENRGAAAARNRGAREATGEILLFLDDDMICAPDILKEHARMYRSGADAVVGDFPMDSDSPEGFLSDSIAEQEHWERGAAALTPFDVFTGQLSVRRRVFEQLGGFDESFTANGNYGNEDVDFGARLLERFTLRHNPRAICRQRTAVGPREYMRRAKCVARADLRFAAKHPQLARELMERRGLGRNSRRLRLLSRLPVVPAVLSGLAVSSAEIGLRTRFRSSRKLAYFFNGAYLVTYWAALRAAGGEIH